MSGIVTRIARRMQRKIRCQCSGWPHTPWCPRSRRSRKAGARPRPRGGALPRLSEREARDVLGMPQGHPENLTRPLRRADERMLTALCGELWPDDEYVREL